MEQLNINSYPSVVDAIDNKNIVEIEKLSKNINKSNKNDKGNQKDIILKLYNTITYFGTFSIDNKRL